MMARNRPRCPSQSASSLARPVPGHRDRLLEEARLPVTWKETHAEDGEAVRQAAETAFMHALHAITAPHTVTATSQRQLSARIVKHQSLCCLPRPRPFPLTLNRYIEVRVVHNSAGDRITEDSGYHFAFVSRVGKTPLRRMQNCAHGDGDTSPAISHAPVAHALCR